jgi:hypothetical protein
VAVVASPLIAFLSDYLVSTSGIHCGRELVLAGLAVSTSICFWLHSVPDLLEMEASSRFEYFMFIRTLYAASISPTYSISTGIALSHLARLGIDKQALGQERLYGVYSWAFVNLVMGIAIDYTDTRIMYLFTAVALIPLLICLYWCGLEAAAKINPSASVRGDIAMNSSAVRDSGDADVELVPLAGGMSSCSSTSDVDGCECEGNVSVISVLQTPSSSNNDRSNGMWTDVLSIFKALFATPTGAMFTVLLIVLKVGTSIVENLVFLFFTDTLGSSNFVCGLSVVITVIFEVPIFSYSEVMLKHLGYFYMLLISCLCYAIRVVGYTLVPNGLYVLFLEPLHGLTFGLAMLASTDYTATIANNCSKKTGNSSGNSKLGATAQAVMSSLQSGLGVLIGTGGGGAVEQHFGSHVLYRGAAVLVSCTAAVFALVFWFYGDPTGAGSGSLCSSYKGSFTLPFSWLGRRTPVAAGSAGAKALNQAYEHLAVNADTVVEEQQCDN